MLPAKVIVCKLLLRGKGSDKRRDNHATGGTPKVTLKASECAVVIPADWALGGEAPIQKVFANTMRFSAVTVPPGDANGDVATHVAQIASLRLTLG